MNRHRIVLVALLASFSTGVVQADTLLVLNKEEATLWRIDIASGKTVATVNTGEGPHEIEVSTDRNLAFVTNYGTASKPGNSISAINIEARKELRVDLGELGRPHGVTFTDNHLYFTSEASKKIGRYDPGSGRIDWQFDTGQEGTHMVLASRDGTKLYTSNIASNTVGIIEHDASGNWQQTLVKVGAGPEGLDESPDGKQLWSAHSRDGKVSVIDVATKKVVHTLDVQTKRSNRLKFTPDGKLALISDLGSGDLVIVDTQTHKPRTRIPLGRMPEGILVARDGASAFVAVAGENHIAVVDLKSLTVTKTIATGNGPDGMAWAR